MGLDAGCSIPCPHSFELNPRPSPGLPSKDSYPSPAITPGFLTFPKVNSGSKLGCTLAMILPQFPTQPLPHSHMVFLPVLPNISSQLALGTLPRLLVPFSVKFCGLLAPSSLPLEF